MSDIDPEDPGFCGLDPLVTGPLDPFWKRACKPHDDAFNKMKIALRTDSGVQPFVRFVKDTGIVALQGAYAVLAFPLYVVIGGVGGLVRWNYLKRSAITPIDSSPFEKQD